MPLPPKEATPNRRDFEDHVFMSDNLIRFAIELEIEARALILRYLKGGSEAWTLLKADRSLQIRTLEDVSGDTLGLRHFLPAGEQIQSWLAMDEIELVEAYRHTFAGLLASASQLKKQQLETAERFEGRKARSPTHHEKPHHLPRPPPLASHHHHTDEPEPLMEAKV